MEPLIDKQARVILEAARELIAEIRDEAAVRSYPEKLRASDTLSLGELRGILRSASDALSSALIWHDVVTDTPAAEEPPPFIEELEEREAETRSSYDSLAERELVAERVEEGEA